MEKCHALELPLVFLCILSGSLALGCQASPLRAPAALEDCRAIVTAPKGRFQGVEDTDDTCAYLGIPYGAPPKGEQRFRPPQPYPPISGVLAANQIPPVCAQIISFRNQFLVPPVGSEDCLYLNIYRPRVRGGPYPVMVFIHGGAFTVGSGSWPQYRGSYLARHGVVVVTINYRLGPLGFLALPELKEEDPQGSYGNYGILDQILALKWVQENISAFGGDPQRVTIFGESAGGMSVCTLLALPEARQYFQGAIIESGGCTAVGEEGRSFAQGVSFAERLGCKSPGAERLRCLRATPLEELLLKGRPDVLWDGFQPRLDGVLLKKTPLEILSSGEARGIPLLAGANADELMLGIIVNPPSMAYKFLPWERFWQRLKEMWGEEQVSALKTFYPQEQYPDPVSLWEEILGDVVLRCPTELAVRTQAQFEPRTFHYMFTWNRTFTRSDALQAFHGYELAFVFGVFEAWDGIFGEDLEKALALRETIQSYWSQFARTGDPNLPSLPRWNPYSTGETQLLGEEIKGVRNPLKERCTYWAPRLPLGIDGLTQGVWDLGGG